MREQNNLSKILFPNLDKHETNLSNKYSSGSAVLKETYNSVIYEEQFRKKYNDEWEQTNKEILENVHNKEDERKKEISERIPLGKELEEQFKKESNYSATDAHR